ncbi:methyl-accepting chemotaxis protein [Dongia sedimenti]|uniref:Methyl-accepting chemotaxis protein n=1 Tax=Dongia sedimenti TaxID=3064282 RepID=A0ABU0YNK5_9PROT|nr:methyl-accepting chemotaxis protein [Rhodospirillaceae bacterium R-7]
MKNLKIRTKIYGAFAAVLVLMSVLGGFAIFELAAVNQASTDMAVNWMPSIKTVGQLDVAIGDFRIEEEMHVLQTDDEGMAAQEKAMAEIKDRIAGIRKVYEPLISSDDERTTYDAFSKLWDEYLGINKDVLAFSRGNENDKARDLLNAKSRELFEQAGERIARLASINQAGGEDASANGDALYSSSRIFIIGLVAVSLALAGSLAYLIVRNVSAPITRMTVAMTRLGQGDKSIDVIGTERGDEIGGMANALQVFKDTAIEADRMAAEQAAAQEARLARARIIDELTENFDREATAVVKTVASAATEMQATATSMTATAEETARQSTAVAAASEEASTNVQTVASATEELTASISEITTQVTESTRIVGEAVHQAGETTARVQGLSEAAQKIGDVVRLINDIAGQTNLLALNATIEAARAGEAGKGFAVVASEVKTLATQTARATEEIAGQVRSIQEATASSAQAIENITRTIGRVNEISTAIASAVEEQGAATQEIARNVQQAAIGTQEVSSNIVSVTEAAQHTGAAASQLLAGSNDLAKQAEIMRTEVEKYIAGVKAA